MCGILGSLGHFPLSKFEDGLHRLAHRGPDGFDIWNNEAGVYLGHRRLAILELGDLGKQPMEDEHLVITFNGEIYNFKELRNILMAKGHQFKSDSDTEVILKAYKQWGAECLNHFNGMWAFAIWDKRKEQFFIARDRFGVKPLFYAFTQKGFVFGSEMKAITPLLDAVVISEDFEWCYQNMYGYERTHKSLIKDIMRFPAGHYAFYTPNSTSLDLHEYWNTLDHLVRPEEKYEDQVAHFKELFFDACKIRMRSDVKIGTALSGGLDSSSVAAAMNYIGSKAHKDRGEHMADDWQNAFIATFSGTELDEKVYAEEVVNSLNLKGHFFEIDAVKGIDDIEDYLWYFEELFLTSPIPMVEVYKGIKTNGVSVSLDGHGADELFSGYGNMLFQAIKDQPFNTKAVKNTIDTYKGIRASDKSSFETMVDGFEGKKNLMKFYMEQLMGKKSKDPVVHQMGYFNAALYDSFHNSFLPTLLRNYDRYSMTASVEVRMPFLDYRLVSYCFSLPPQSKLHGGYTKSILRDAMEPYLSKGIVRRKLKTGFGTPFTDWLTGPWKAYVSDMVLSAEFKNSEIGDSSRVQKMVEEFYQKTKPSFHDGHEVWKALMPFLWEKSFFKKLDK